MTESQVNGVIIVLQFLVYLVQVLALGDILRRVRRIEKVLDRL